MTKFSIFVFILSFSSIFAQVNEEEFDRFALLPLESKVVAFDSSVKNVANSNILAIVENRAKLADSVSNSGKIVLAKIDSLYKLKISAIITKEKAEELLAKFPLEEGIFIISKYKDANPLAENLLPENQRFLLYFSNGKCECDDSTAKIY